MTSAEIGNSGPLPESVAREVKDRQLVAVSVLSGNRNFEGRIQPLVRAAGDGAQKQFSVRVRIDTPQELQYYLHGGILPYVLRNLLKG